MTDKILIDGHQFTAVKTINLTKDATVCKHRVENQTEIADHVTLNPAVFEFELELFNPSIEHQVSINSTTGETESTDVLIDEYDILDTLYRAAKPFTLMTHRGQYDNMIVSKLSDAKGTTSVNTTSATITIEEIRIGKSQTVKTVETPAKDTVVPTTIESLFGGGAHIVSLTKVETSLTDNWDESASAKTNLQGFGVALESANNISSLL